MTGLLSSNADLQVSTTMTKGQPTATAVPTGRSQLAISESALVEQLRQPRIFHDGATRVDVVETHISWVFLTERFAYKLKKPVRFEFLDFSSLEQRRLACLQEVKLNRRLAADVYVDVVPVTRDNRGRVQVGGSGTPIEWLVKMKRLPDSHCLAHLLVEHQLSRNDLDRLAMSLVRFYERLPPVTVHAAEYVRGLERHVTANQEELSRAAGQLPSVAVARVLAAQRRFTHLGRELLIDRVRDGRVVDGHGDLRPEHVYLMSTPKIIDCLEFSEELRRVDVADELAFLAMECDLLGEPLVGKRIFEDYSAISGDRLPPRLVAFFKTYRACVRAKVQLLRARQVADDAAVRLRGQAERYLQLADSYVSEIDSPCMVVVRGLSGAGKSTVAEAVARDIGGELLQTDALRRRLFPEAAMAAYGEGSYSAKHRDQVYEELLRQAADRLGQKLSVVLDGTFLGRSWRQRALEVASRNQAQVLFVHCLCDPALAMERVRERRAAKASSLSDAQPELVSVQQTLEEPDDPTWSVCSVDTTDGLPAILARIYDRLRPMIGY